MGTDWIARARCLGANTDLFFPSESDFVPAEVRVTCDKCPVRRQCLAYAMADPDIEGIWAGTSQKQRKRLRRDLSSRRAS